MRFEDHNGRDGDGGFFRLLAVLGNAGCFFRLRVRFEDHNGRGGNGGFFRLLVVLGDHGCGCSSFFRLPYAVLCNHNRRFFRLLEGIGMRRGKHYGRGRGEAGGGWRRSRHIGCALAQHRRLFFKRIGHRIHIGFGKFGRGFDARCAVFVHQNGAPCFQIGGADAVEPLDFADAAACLGGDVLQGDAAVGGVNVPR